MTKRIMAFAIAAAFAVGLAAAPAQADAPATASKVTFSKMGWDWGGF